MNKQSISLAVIGVIIGFIGGFVLANKINRDAALQPVNTNAVQNQPFPNAQNPQIQSADIKDKPTGAMLPDIAEKLEKATKEPDNFEAQITAGDMYSQIQKFDKALEFYQKANKIKPDDYKTIIKLGNSNFDLKNYEAAEKWYESALAKNPNDVDVRTDLGSTFMERAQPDLDRAIKEYRASLNINPAHENTLFNISLALMRKGDKQGAQEMLNQFEKVSPQSPLIAKLKQKLAETN